ncbi:MAG TPA: hypothetical protein DCK95_01370 [Anaerolineaceae bacterium]|uniref:Nuclease SbcCD subunit C n=1 Tax=Anaerolinea thermophila TaxID=167964 RepID=A0A101FYJ6_9CHLR|nr:MAG: Putative nuclease SbcCD subunit C [Anaerolinea thermophila]HAF60958.1 hypothetical protein [Anaerolineaceae bacterium]
MIPVRLQLRGFLSYQDAVDLSFEGFDLACISGDNGAGKSSLLDAITWVLFGKARRSDDGVINNRSEEAEVIYTFQYENDLYRVQRVKAREKSMLLEFQIQNEDHAWKPLTEHTLTETQNRIYEVLHLDYDTFINASFFLQGKADEFTQKNSTQRKEILAGILGMDVWESYRDTARELRRSLEGYIQKVEGSLDEIEEELAQEEQRKQELKNTTAALKLVEDQRKEKQKILQQAQQLAAALHTQQVAWDGLEKQREQNRLTAKQLLDTIAERQQEAESFKKVLADAQAIEKAYQERLNLKIRLQEMDELSTRYLALLQKKTEHEKTIAMETSRIQQEIVSLQKEENKIRQMRDGLALFKQKKQQLLRDDVDMQLELEKQNLLKDEVEQITQHLSRLLAENKTLNETMQKLKGRLDRLQGERSTSCPLCGQPLSEEHRLSVVSEIEAEGKRTAQQYRKNGELIKKLSQEQEKTKRELVDLDVLAQKQQSLRRELDVLSNNIERNTTEIIAWEGQGKDQLISIRQCLEENACAPDAQKNLALVEEELRKLGYEPQLHADLRKGEQESRASEQAQQELLIARNRLEPLQREIETMRSQHQTLEKESSDLIGKQQQAQQLMEDLEKNDLDLRSLEVELHDLVEQENHQRALVGGAKQMLEVIGRQKQRKQHIHEQLRSLSKQKAQLQMLEKAFGRDGVQALLMEEALPQMESQANDTLNRLSSGTMSVRFETEREYKDKKRDDKMQVLDILINDAEGVQRPYDLFSGGEAFRINFAIRLALSKVLAQRAGARLQMLVIDEGFGSQDEEGRQKLVEAINMIRPDFKKILVITHLEELKDAFQVRIEVRKTKQGSQVEVISQ